MMTSSVRGLTFVPCLSSPFCSNYCGDGELTPCSACGTLDNTGNCYYDNTGANCYLETL